MPEIRSVASGIAIQCMSRIFITTRLPSPTWPRPCVPLPLSRRQAPGLRRRGGYPWSPRGRAPRTGGLGAGHVGIHQSEGVEHGLREAMRSSTASTASTGDKAFLRYRPSKSVADRSAGWVMRPPSISGQKSLVGYKRGIGAWQAEKPPAKLAGQLALLCYLVFHRVKVPRIGYLDHRSSFPPIEPPTE